jgi:hypothetical protein
LWRAYGNSGLAEATLKTVNGKLNNLNLLNEIQFAFYNLQFTFKTTDGGELRSSRNLLRGAERRGKLIVLRNQMRLPRSLSVARNDLASTSHT